MGGQGSVSVGNAGESTRKIYFLFSKTFFYDAMDDKSREIVSYQSQDGSRRVRFLQNP